MRALLVSQIGDLVSHFVIHFCSTNRKT